MRFKKGSVDMRVFFYPNRKSPNTISAISLTVSSQDETLRAFLNINNYIQINSYGFFDDDLLGSDLYVDNILLSILSVNIRTISRE